jgi:hypothetical protein
MSRVQTEFTSLLYSIEASLGTLAGGTPNWKLVEPNSYGTLGSQIKKVARQPISKQRQKRKGILVDLDSSVEFECDVTLESVRDFGEAICLATHSGYTSGPIHLESGAGFDSLAAVSATGFSYTAIVGSTVPANRLVFARGFSTAALNGLWVVTAGSTTSSVAVSTLPASETPTQGQNATVEVCGVRGAVGDISMDANGNLTSAVLDFTTLGLTVGQFIKIGGALAANQFATAAYNGTARVMAVAAHLLTLDKRSWTVGSADTGAGQLIDVLFGQFTRNVPVDDARFVERSLTFEASMVGLQNPGPGDEYLYPKGNFANEMGFNLPLTDKAVMQMKFIGTDTPNPTTVRATGANNAVQPVQTAGFGTSSDIIRLSLRDGTTQVDQSAFWKKVDLKINNGVTPEKILALLGAKYMNVGILSVDLDAEALFTTDVLLSAIRNNTTMTMDFILRNSDGGVAVDIPSMTIGDGKLNLPRYKTVTIQEKCEAFIDATLGYSISFSGFPYLP